MHNVEWWILRLGRVVLYYIVRSHFRVVSPRSSVHCVLRRLASPFASDTIARSPISRNMLISWDIGERMSRMTPMNASANSTFSQTLWRGGFFDQTNLLCVMVCSFVVCYCCCRSDNILFAVFFFSLALNSFFSRSYAHSMVCVCAHIGISLNLIQLFSFASRRNALRDAARMRSLSRVLWPGRPYICRCGDSFVQHVAYATDNKAQPPYVYCICPW